MHSTTDTADGQITQAEFEAAHQLENVGELNIAGTWTEAQTFSVQNSASNAILAQVAGDSVPRFAARADGRLEIGSGSAARDTNLYRDTADSMKTDDNFTCNNLDSQNGIVNRAGSIENKHNSTPKFLMGTDQDVELRRTDYKSLGISVSNTAPTDGNMANGSIVFYLDESGNNLVMRVKYSDGSLKTTTNTLA